VGAVVAVVAATADVRGAIGFSSFGVLVYYAIANVSAWTLSSRPSWVSPVRVTAGCGLTGCLALAFALPTESVAAGTAVLAVGAVVYAVRRRR
jgi:APA family basic amino acid/polyamine antiporter